jgi:hypothetical protein
MVSKEYLARVLQPTCSNDVPDGSILVERHDIIDDWTRVRNEWILIKGGGTKTFKFDHNIYSGQELKDRLLQAGFSSVWLFGNIDGDAYGLNAERLVVLAEK